MRSAVPLGPCLGIVVRHTQPTSHDRPCPRTSPIVIHASGAGDRIASPKWLCLWLCLWLWLYTRPSSPVPPIYTYACRLSCGDAAAPQTMAACMRAWLPVREPCDAEPWTRAVVHVYTSRVGAHHAHDRFLPALFLVRAGRGLSLSPALSSRSSSVESSMFRKRTLPNHCGQSVCRCIHANAALMRPAMPTRKRSEEDGANTMLTISSVESAEGEKEGT